jgi:peptidoglycan-associated lipoprotein
MKLNKHIVFITVSVAFALLASGCSTKSDVAYDSIAPTSKVVNKQEDVKETHTVEEISNVNVVTSIVNGKDVALKSVHFAFDKFSISDDMRIVTKNNYEAIDPLVSDNPRLKIKLEGNCDEWGTDEYNYALGLKRAKVIKDALVNDGVPSDKIVLVTFGKSNPVCSDKSEKCWKKNRRTDYRLLP